jgi:hypothetical protein
VLYALLSIWLLAAQTASPGTLKDNGDGTVTDQGTILMWQQRDDGVKRTWSEAKTYCEELALAANSDWRLPDIKELASIISWKQKPAINNKIFSRTRSDTYWSSTSNYNRKFARAVDFDSGSTRLVYKTSNYYVRCVR